MVFVNTQRVQAFSWFEGQPTFTSERDTSPNEQLRSSCTYKTVYIISIQANKSVCVFQGKNVRFASYHNGSPQLLISAGADTRMYSLNGIETYNSGPPLLVPGTDILIVKNRSTRVLEFYDNILSKLSRSYGTFGETQYSLTGLPDKSMSISLGGGYVQLSGIAWSSNSKWLALQTHYDQEALIRVNLEDLSSSVIATYTMTANGLGAILAISDDGSHIATGGRDRQLTIYKSSGCGDPVTERSLSNRNSLYSPCSERSLADLLPELADENWYPFEANELIFDYVGGKLDIKYFSKRHRENRAMTVLAEGYVPPRIEYLALGDSYSSGEGDINRTPSGNSYYVPMTDTIPDDCHISSRSYPYLLRSAWSISQSGMKSIACSGAQITPDYTGSIIGYTGQGERLKGDSKLHMKQQSALDEFIPGRVPQLEFVKKYKPKVVTFTGSGNDIGFAKIITYCALPDFGNLNRNTTCGYAENGSDLNKLLYSTIDSQYLAVSSFIQSIKQYSPDTKIIIVGYPKFVKESGFDTCFNGAFLDGLERDMINDAVEYTNQMLLKVANENDTTFVDVQDSLVGGRVCEGSEYVNGVYETGLDKLLFNLRGKEAMFHPNAEGHGRLARTIIDSGVLSIDIENSESTYIVKPNNVISVNEEMIGGGAIVQGQDSSELRVDVHTFEENGVVTVMAYSDPINLGVFRADSEGALNAKIDMSSLPLGVHVVKVSGKSRSGELLTLFQFITAKFSESDADGDGIADSKDPCDYIEHWYDEKTGEDTCIMNDRENTSEALTESGVSIQGTNSKTVSYINTLSIASDSAYGSKGANSTNTSVLGASSNDAQKKGEPTTNESSEITSYLFLLPVVVAVALWYFHKTKSV